MCNLIALQLTINTQCGIMELKVRFEMIEYSPWVHEVGGDTGTWKYYCTACKAEDKKCGERCCGLCVNAYFVPDHPQEEE